MQLLLSIFIRNSKFKLSDTPHLYTGSLEREIGQAPRQKRIMIWYNNKWFSWTEKDIDVVGVPQLSIRKLRNQPFFATKTLPVIDPELRKKRMLLAACQPDLTTWPQENQTP